MNVTQNKKSLMRITLIVESDRNLIEYYVNPHDIDEILSYSGFQNGIQVSIGAIRCVPTLIIQQNSLEIPSRPMR